MNDALLVAIGAVPGAWLRWQLVNHLAFRLPRRHWGTLLVNVGACFLLGLLLPLCRQRPHSPWIPLLAVGFLGSASTFSTLMLELHALLLGARRRSALLLLLASLGLGLAALGLGLRLVGG